MACSLHFAVLPCVLAACSSVTSTTVDASSDASTGSDVVDHDVVVDATIDAPADASKGFVHPGILVNQADLDFVKAQLAANAEPYTSTFMRTTTESGNGQTFGDVSYTPHPVATLDCTADATGCASFVYDAIAAYTDALTHYFKGDSAHAETAITIINAWSSTLKAWNGSQAQLEGAWVADVFSRAAEIVRYTFAPTGTEAKLDVASCSSMLASVLVPAIKNGAPTANGNWELAMATGMIAIGVFTDDTPTFQAGVAMWKARVPAYIYLTTDGSRPNAPPGGKFTTATSVDCFWLASGAPVPSCAIPSGFAYVNGMVQETCRDMGHVALGLAAMTNGAETARIQGVDLYGSEKERLSAAYEFSTKYDTDHLTTSKWPTSPCGGAPANGMGGVGYELGWEVAFNELSNRLGVAMPSTSTFITTVVRPSTYKAGNCIAWESLTSVGAP